MSKDSERENPFQGGFQMPSTDGISLESIAPAYGIPSGGNQPDFITNNPRGRDSMGRITFNTGVGWFGGFVGGGFYGAYKGVAGAPSSTMKVRVNSMLNGVSKYGGTLGNNLGVLGEYHCINSLVMMHIYTSIASILLMQNILHKVTALLKLTLSVIFVCCICSIFVHVYDVGSGHGRAGPHIGVFAGNSSVCRVHDGVRVQTRGWATRRGTGRHPGRNRVMRLLGRHTISVSRRWKVLKEVRSI
jgi:hypothetical protein